MATMRDIKRRKSSIESTEQITKAMKLVATVKLQKSRTKAENSRLYFNLMYQTIQEMLKKSTGIRHRYLKSGDYLWNSGSRWSLWRSRHGSRKQYVRCSRSDSRK